MKSYFSLNWSACRTPQLTRILWFCVFANRFFLLKKYVTLLACTVGAQSSQLSCYHFRVFSLARARLLEFILETSKDQQISTLGVLGVVYNSTSVTSIFFVNVCFSTIRTGCIIKTCINKDILLYTRQAFQLTQREMYEM